MTEYEPTEAEIDDALAFIRNQRGSDVEGLARALKARDASTAKVVTLALAHRAEAVIGHGDVAEVAAPVEGQTGREAAMHARDALHEEPGAWIRGQVEHLGEILDAYETYEAPEEPKP